MTDPELQRVLDLYAAGKPTLTASALWDRPVVRALHERGDYGAMEVATALREACERRRDGWERERGVSSGS